MHLKDSCTVLVCSCDKYSDLWDPFFELFSYYWSDCPFDVILNTETKKYDYANLGIKTFSLYEACKPIPYGKRMIDHLKRIKTPYTLILLDDFFLRKQVDTHRLETIIDCLGADKNVISFNFIPVSDKYNTKSNKYVDFDLRPVFGPYKLNFQAAVWRTDKLKNYWRENDTPWSWELYGNMRTFSKKYRFYSLSEGQEPIFDYGFKLDGMGVYHGKWVLDTVEDLFKKHDISVDFSNRGIYLPDDASTKRSIESEQSDESRFASGVGPFWYSRYIFWCFLKKIRIINEYQTFEEYLSSKNKNKKIEE